MAIYHLEAKVVSRGAGRSACAASAYLSCSHILNDYDGVQHDYTRKQGLVWQEVFLPDMAPPAWQDREVLWNAVEENEKTKDSRLAREFVVALPIELSLEQWQTLLTDFVQNQFVADGMCADLAIHDPDPPGHNPHAHILLTVRPLDESGKWQYKTEKEYLCSRDGEERGFTAAEFKAAQADGWEKQYQYKVGRKKVYMTPSAAEEHGYERASKYPKSTKYGRQNPISERWNSEEQLLIWRKAWADVTNKYLERSFTHSSASGSHFKMLFAILLQVEPYFAASSAIACSVRAKNSSMIFTSSNKVSTSSPMYYGSGGQSYRSEGKFHTFIIVHCNSIFYRLSKIVWHQSRSLGSLKIWSFGFGRVARSRGGVTKN